MTDPVAQAEAITRDAAWARDVLHLPSLIVPDHLRAVTADTTSGHRLILAETTGRTRAGPQDTIHLALDHRRVIEWLVTLGEAHEHMHRGSR